MVASKGIPLEDIIDKSKLQHIAILSLDPGVTTGYAFWRGGELIASGQRKLSIADLDEFFDEFKYPDTDELFIVIEDYRIYNTKAAQHINSDLFTPRLIGAIEHAGEQRQWGLYKQMAAQAKPFVTDVRLSAWHLYEEGSPHRNDAVRHAMYWFLKHYGKRRTHAG